MLVAAKKRGEQELLAKRERLKLELEKLGRRTDEFPHYSELDMIQQVQYWHVQKLSLSITLAFLYNIG